MRLMSLALALGLAVGLMTADARAQDTWAPEEMTGVKVGEKAPDFKLTGADGKEYALSEMVKEGTVALVFYRSANW